jgi:O-antigen/teichoic acid export membrane protein
MKKEFMLYRLVSGTAGLMLVSKVLVMVIGIFLARLLGPEQFGLYSFIISIIAVVSLPVIAGMPSLLIKEIACFHLDQKWGAIKGIINWSRYSVFIFSFFIFTLMCIGLYLEAFDDSISGYLWLGIVLIPVKSLLIQQEAIFNGLRKPFLAQLPIKIIFPFLMLLILSILLFIDVKVTVTIAIIILVSSYCVSALLTSVLLRTSLSKSIEQPQYEMKRWSKALIPFAAIAFIANLNAELASIILGSITNKESVGYFKVAVQAVTLVSLGLVSINTIILPNVARLYKSGDLITTQKLLTKSVRLSVFISLPIILIFIFFGEFAISVLFGDAYLGAYPILIFLSVGQLVNVLMGSVGVVLNMTGNEKNVLKSTILALIINVTLLLVLVPLYGVIGAAIAVSTSIVLFNFIMAFYVWKLTRLKTWLLVY